MERRPRCGRATGRARDGRGSRGAGYRPRGVVFDVERSRRGLKRRPPATPPLRSHRPVTRTGGRLTERYRRPSHRGGHRPSPPVLRSRWLASHRRGCPLRFGILPQRRRECVVPQEPGWAHLPRRCVRPRRPHAPLAIEGAGGLVGLDAAAGATPAREASAASRTSRERRVQGEPQRGLVGLDAAARAKPEACSTTLTWRSPTQNWRLDPRRTVGQCRSGNRGRGGLDRCSKRPAKNAGSRGRRGLDFRPERRPGRQNSPSTQTQSQIPNISARVRARDAAWGGSHNVAGIHDGAQRANASGAPAGMADVLFL